MTRPVIDPGLAVFRTYVAVVVLFLSLPILVAVGVAFGSDKIARFPPRGFSLQWFAAALTDGAFMKALLNSLELAALTTLLAMLVAVPAALALVWRRWPFQAALEAALLSPLTLPGVLYGLSMLLFVGALGAGLGWGWLVAAHVVITVPYILRTAVAVYRGLDTSYEEAARVLGANPWQVLRHVTLPLLRGALVAGGMFAFLISFDNVPVSIFLTTARDNTLPVTIMSYLVSQDFDATIGAISALQIAVVLALLILLDRLYGVSKLVSMGS